MPVFNVVLLEVHKVGITVQGKDVVDAIKKAQHGEGDFHNVHQEESFLDCADDLGMATEELLKQFPALKKSDILWISNDTADYIPAIYSVEEE